jgi:hypothetical protein
MPGLCRQIRWLALAALLAVAFVALPLAPSEAHTLAGGMPCLHQNEAAKTAPVLSPLPMHPPCDQHHCVHGPFCCMSSCLGFSGLAVMHETPLLAPPLDLTLFPLPPPTRPSGFGVRPALPPPRAFV